MLASTLCACARVNSSAPYISSPESANAAQAVRGHAVRTNSTSGKTKSANAQSATVSQGDADEDQQDANIAGTSDSPIFNNGNFWSHLHANFQLPPSANRPEVQEQINWYVHHQQYLDRVVNRAAPYLYYILERVQERDLPAELVLLPIMESAYNPFANSCRGAAGLWQLMTPTAGNFGVKQDWWYDGRRDIYASTNAALDYLTYLQSYFGGDWMLAIAAYDAGEGSLQNAVRRNEREDRPTDFFSLQLPLETRSYVPRLLALAAIISNPSRYGITLPNISDQPYIQQVDIGVPINLSQAAQLANMNLADIKALNPGYSHMTTDPNGPYKLLLPVDHIPIFKQNLAQMPGLSQTVWNSYRVQHSDTLNAIAKRYHTTIASLKMTNHLKGSHAPAGKVIMVPGGTVMVKPHIAEDNSPINTASPKMLSQQKALTSVDDQAQQQQAQQQVQQPTQDVMPAANYSAGLDASSSVNNQSDNVAASVAAAQETNNLTQAINNQAPTAAQQEVADNSAPDDGMPQASSHTVKAGDTLNSIAKQYHVRTSDLQKWNHQAGRHLKPGSKIMIVTPATHHANIASSAKHSRVAAHHSNSFHVAHAAAKSSKHLAKAKNPRLAHGTAKKAG